jgi:uncharacterized membrane protein
MTAGTARRLALASHLVLIAALLVWELVIAPPTPVTRAFWAGIKIAPLLLPLYWLARGSAYAHFYTALLMLLYFADGTALAYVAGKQGAAGSMVIGLVEATAALMFIAAGAYYVRLSLSRATARSPE